MTHTTFPTFVSRELLHEWSDFSRAEATVGAALVDLGSNTHRWMHFILAYAAWNARFANGVAALASFIGEQKNLFKDTSVPAVVSDRSNYIASFVFDAARDEYDDRTEEHRDTQRCLGQATIMGAADFFAIDLHTISEPQWVHSFSNTVLAGYTGINALQNETAQTHPLPGELLHRIFQGLGYHLGSELLAGREFSILDSFLRSQHPELVEHLQGYTTTFAGGLHHGYAWIGVSRETDTQALASTQDKHFGHALQGVNEALTFVPAHLSDECILALRHGFLRFSNDHAHFFQRAGQVID